MPPKTIGKTSKKTGKAEKNIPKDKKQIELQQVSHNRRRDKFRHNLNETIKYLQELSSSDEESSARKQTKKRRSASRSSTFTQSSRETDYDSAASSPTSTLPLSPRSTPRTQSRSTTPMPSHSSLSPASKTAPSVRAMLPSTKATPPPSGPTTSTAATPSAATLTAETLITSQGHPASMAHNPGFQVYTAYVCNLDRHMLTPKGFLPYINRIQNLEVFSTIPTRNGKMLVKSPDSQLLAKLKQLKMIISTDVVIEPPKTTMTAPNNTTNPIRLPSFSCVITGVGKDITIDEIRQVLQHNNIHFKDIWRIKSRQTNQFTRLVRVLTTDQRSLDRLLAEGIWIANFPHRVERSRPPIPQPYQCGKCQDYHDPGEYCKKIVCSYCGGSHNFKECNALDKPARCAVCGETGHAAVSSKCPMRPKTPSSAANTAILKTVDQPSSDPSDSPASKHDVLRLVTLAVLNAVPDQWVRVEKHIAGLAAALFNVRLTVSHAGGRVHVGCHPLQPMATPPNNQL